jgi:3-hydroxyisobutyrate dehydrogenase-like beta-hydroxyacid dehydrogenase
MSASSTASADGANTPGPVALVGLGLVGTALGQRLRRAGYAVLGHDRRPEACAAWRAAGGEVVASLRELGERCACAVLAVFDTAGVLEVVEGRGAGIGEGPGGSAGKPVNEEVGKSAAAGCLAAGSALRAVVDCSTGDPEALQALAARLATRGIAFLEAPLSGSSQQIAAGEATMLLGGEAAAVAAHAALLEALSPRRIHVGGAGMGARAKLATNLVLGLNRAVLAEGLVFAERLGIPPATFVELVLATPARSDAALAKGRQMVQGDFAPRSRIHQHLKDVQLMLAGAAAAGQRLPFSETHAALLRAAVASGDGELDNAAIVRQLRRETR